MSHPLPANLLRAPKLRLGAVALLGVSGGVLGTAFGLGAARVMPPVYRSAATVEFVAAPGTMPLSDSARDARIDGLVEMARSLPVATAALDDGGLRRDPELADTATGGDPAIALALLDHSKIERIGATTLIRIEAHGADPRRAARFAGAIATALITRSLGDRIAAIVPPDRQLDADVVASRDRAERADAALADVRARFALIGPLAPQDSGQADLLRGALIGARADAAAAAARAASAQSRVVVSSATVGQNGTASLGPLRTQRAEVARRVAQLADRFTPGYPLLTSARVELATLDRAIGTELDSLAASAAADAAAARSRASALDVGLANVEQRRARAIGAEAELAQAQRGADAAREAYRQLATSAAQRKTEQSLARPELRLAAPATAPLRPSSPDRQLLTLFAAFSLALAGALGGLAIERRRLATAIMLFAV